MLIPNAEYIKIQQVLPILCVDLVMIYQARCLLLRRLNHPAKDQWWLPGGRVLKNETIKDATVRKAREEVGLNGRFNGILSVEESFFPCLDGMLCDVHTVNICCHIVVDDIAGMNVDSAHNGYQWVDIDHARNLNLHECVIRPICLCLSETVK